MKKLLSSLFILSAVFFVVPNDTQAQTTSQVCTNLVRNVNRFSRGADVVALQKFLISSGYLSSEVTGYYGSLTVSAVMKFQRANGISPVNGNVGPLTRAKIKALTCGTTSIVPASNPVTNPVFDKLLLAINDKNQSSGVAYDGNFDLNNDGRVNVTDNSVLNTVINRTASLSIFDTVSSKLIQAVYSRQGNGTTSPSYMRNLDMNNDDWILGEDTVMTRNAFNSVKPASQSVDVTVQRSAISLMPNSVNGDSNGVTAMFELKVKPVGGSLPLPTFDSASITLQEGSSFPTVIITSPASSVTVSGSPSVLAEGAEYIVTYTVSYASTTLRSGTYPVTAKLNTVKFGTLTPVNVNHTTSSVTWSESGEVSTTGNLIALNSATTPPATSLFVPADGLSKISVFDFALKSTSNDSLVKSISIKVQNSTSASSPIVPISFHLYSGNTLLASESYSTTAGKDSIVFSNLSILIGKNNTSTFSVKADIPGNISGGTSLTLSHIATQYVLMNGYSGSANQVINGNTQTFNKQTTPQITLQSSNISTLVGNNGVNASFVLKVKPVGGSLELPRADQAVLSLMSGNKLTVYETKNAGSVMVSGNPSVLAEGAEYVITIGSVHASTSIPSGTNLVSVRLNSVKFGSLNPVTLNYDTSSVSFTKSSTVASVATVKVEGDVNGDGRVTQTDLDLLNSGYGSSRGDAKYLASADFNNDGAINFFDLTFLAQRMGNGVVTTSLVPLGGDCNADNTVNFSDLTRIAQIYGSKLGDSLYHQGCDFNLDGFIDKYDMDILNANYGKSLSASGTVLGATVASSCTVLTQPLQRGSMDIFSDGEVTLLQNYLEKVGYSFADKGVFGPVTEIAVKDWQVKKGILATGIIGPISRAQIESETCN